MNIERYIFIFFLSCFVQLVYSQSVLSKKVTDADTGEPIVGAVVFDAETSKALTVTNSDGYFSIPKTDYSKIKITCVGYAPLIASTSDVLYVMHAEVSEIGEVVVTAQESHEPTSASVIQRHAMEHLQPSSFADLLELLPGNISKDPQLDAPNVIHIREIPVSNADYATTSLGTSFVVDGAPISTNANIQYIAGAWETSATSRDITNAGVDMRTISTDDIESVEIVRGIPSVEYGELTSGLVKIERRRGGRDFRARLKADMNSKLLYIAKDMQLPDSSSTLNVSADYLNSKADPRNKYENYSRLTVSGRWSKQTNMANNELKLAFNADYSGSFDAEKEDPDVNNGLVDKYKSDYNRVALMFKADLKQLDNRWFKGANLTLSGSYQHDLITRTKTVSLQTFTGAVQNTTEGEYDELILPYMYEATQKADGKPFNMFVKGNMQMQIPLSRVANRLLIGAEWNVDKNYGDGQLFDTTRPVYPSANLRMRSLSLKPAIHILSFYAEEKLTMPLGNSKIEFIGGVRTSQMLNLPSGYALRGKINIDPRVNIGITLPRFVVANQASFLTFSGGLGKHTKMPTIDQLFPDPVYVDLQQLKYYNVNPEYSKINIRTYIIDGYNPTLEAARNIKKELSVDLNIGGNRLAVTYFNENMESGFRSQVDYASYEYKKYDNSSIEASTLTAAPELANLPYELTKQFYAYSHYVNGSQTKKQGVEYTLSSKRFDAAHTRLTIIGAWLRTTYHNSQLVMERPSVVVDNARLPYVGLYRDDDGVIYESANTNFIVDTDIPTLKLGFSIAAQCQWYTSSQRMPLSNIPDAYMDLDCNIHEWTEDCATDIYLKWLVRNNSEALYKRYKVPLALYTNIKVTKKLLSDRLNIAMFCNRIWDYAPSYESNNITVRRHTDPYFGLEMNFKI